MYFYIFPFTGRKTSLNNSDNASAYSVAENRDFTRRKILKTTRESRKQPSLDKKRKTGQVRILVVRSPGVVRHHHNYLEHLRKG